MPKQSLELTPEQREKLREEAKRMFVEELRLRVEHYFKIVIYTVRVNTLSYTGYNSQEYWVLLGQAVPRQYPILPLQ